MVATDELRLMQEFPPVPTEEWEAAIRADLKGADYDKKLVWRTEDGIDVKPYYRAEDTAGLSQFPFAPRGWKMLEPGAPLPSGAARGDLIRERGATVVQELGYAIASAIEARTSSIVFAIGSNYFFEIAKLRAARLLWARTGASSALYIHARTTLSNKSVYDPYTNLLRATTEAVSAIIGGCDALEVRPFRFSERLALNVQRILKEESHLDRVADPAGGSYYVESLTDSIAQAAWALVEQVQAQGGFTAGRQSMEEAVAASRQAREKAVASRRRVLVGVNNYPDLSEVAGDDVEVPREIWREPAMFEEIRRRSDSHPKRPKVLLLTRGDVKMRQARAQFCLNFFGCGGFAIQQSAEYQSSDADLIVLCSADAEYVELAQEVCHRVTQPVIVAGHPKDHIEALNAAGVAGYVHVASNAVETLTYWQDRLGIGRSR